MTAPQPFTLFHFEIGQRVKVLGCDADGFVAQRCDRGNGYLDYNVVWWIDDKRNSEWLLPRELKAI